MRAFFLGALLLLLSQAGSAINLSELYLYGQNYGFYDQGYGQFMNYGDNPAYGLGTGYGSGGYGDALNANFNLKACSSSSQNENNCTSEEPDAGEYEWRFIKNLGWRKFSKYGAARKDWWDYKKNLGWPFHPTYGRLLP